MNASQRLLLDAAEYVRVHGFSTCCGRHGGPRCFVGTIVSVNGNDAALFIFGQIVWGSLSSLELEREGWTAADAIAALEMAADLAAD